MRKRIGCISFAAATAILFPTLSHAQNSNAWYPEPTIPDIHLVELHTHGGLPHVTGDVGLVKILVNHGYAVAYSEEKKGPLFAVYRLGNLTSEGESVEERSFERPPKFQVDLRTTARVSQDDYNGSGFDRGHMAPNFGLRTQYGHLAQLETFYMSNILPQHADLNRKRWQQVEARIASTEAQNDNGTSATGDDIKDLWVISGPIYGNEADEIGDTGIVIPTGFFKIIVRRPTYFDNSTQAIALYFPHVAPYNEADMSEQFVSVDQIEEWTGIDFHPNLPDSLEDRLESEVRDWDWNVVTN